MGRSLTTHVLLLSIKENKDTAQSCGIQSTQRHQRNHQQHPTVTSLLSLEPSYTFQTIHTTPCCQPHSSGQHSPLLKRLVTPAIQNPNFNSLSETGASLFTLLREPTQIPCSVMIRCQLTLGSGNHSFPQEWKEMMLGNWSYK